MRKKWLHERIENKQRLQTLSIDNAWSNKNFLFHLTFRMLQHTSSEVNGYNCLRICSSSSLLQSALFDLKKTVTREAVKRNDDYMIGRLNILRLSHKVVTLPPWLTMSSLPVATSNGTILIFSLPVSQTYSAKLKKLF